MGFAAVLAILAEALASSGGAAAAGTAAGAAGGAGAAGLGAGLGAGAAGAGLGAAAPSGMGAALEGAGGPTSGGMFGSLMGPLKSFGAAAKDNPLGAVSVGLQGLDMLGVGKDKSPSASQPPSLPRPVSGPLSSAPYLDKLQGLSVPPSVRRGVGGGNLSLADLLKLLQQHGMG